MALDNAQVFAFQVLAQPMHASTASTAPPTTATIAFPEAPEWPRLRCVLVLGCLACSRPQLEEQLGQPMDAHRALIKKHVNYVLERMDERHTLTPLMEDDGQGGQAEKAEPEKVVVVGAGAAGLAAASIMVVGFPIACTSPLLSACLPSVPHHLHLDSRPRLAVMLVSLRTRVHRGVCVTSARLHAPEVYPQHPHPPTFSLHLIAPDVLVATELWARRGGFGGV